MKRFAITTLFSVVLWTANADAQTYYYNPSTGTYTQYQTVVSPGVVQSGATIYSPYSNSQSTSYRYSTYNGQNGGYTTYSSPFGSTYNSGYYNNNTGYYNNNAGYYNNFNGQYYYNRSRGWRR